MQEPRTQLPWTPATVLWLKYPEDIDFAIRATACHKELVIAASNLVKGHITPAVRLQAVKALAAARGEWTKPAGITRSPDRCLHPVVNDDGSCPDCGTAVR